MQCFNKTGLVDKQERRAKKFADQNAKQQADHREIGRRYRRGGVLAYRLRDLQKLFFDKYGGPLPERGARVDLIILLHHVAQLGDPSAYAVYRVKWFPWMTDQDLAGLIKLINDKPLSWDADELAEELDLDYATRTRLGITTIGATDFPKRQRMKRRQKLKNEARRASRIEAGAVPHAMSAARLKPWLDLGMSRATYFRRQKRQDGLPTETRETDSRTAALEVVYADSQQARRRPLQKDGTWARAVLALSAGDGVIYSDREVPRENLYASARARILKTETPLNASSNNTHGDAFSCNASSSPREVFSKSKMQIKPKEEIMPKHYFGYADPPPDVPDYFEALMWQYRRRDNRAAAREALQRVIDESDDPAQTRCLLMDAVVKLREEPRPDDIVTLAEFIEAGSWRAENLEFNAAAAAAVERAKLVPLFRDRRVA